jgi:hypothetical protein
MGLKAKKCLYHVNVHLILSFVFQVENVKAILEVEVSQMGFVILGTYFSIFQVFSSVRGPISFLQTTWILEVFDRRMSFRVPLN